MKSVKCLVVILIMAMSIFLLIGCLSIPSQKSNVSNQERTRKVVMVGKLNHGDYWKNVQMGAQIAAKELNVNLVYLAPDTEENAAQQIQYINQSMRNGMDALVIASSDYTATTGKIENVQEQKIPVIAIDSDVASSRIQSYIGTDNYQAGKTAGAKLLELIKDHPRIGIMSSVKGGGNELQKESGLQDMVSHHPDSQIVDIEYCNANQTIAEMLTKRMLSDPDRINGIVALDVISAVGVANEVKRLGLDGKVKIITFDSSQEELGLLQDGVIQATIIQNPFRMGYLSVKYAVDAMDGKEVPKRLEMDTKVIDLDNMFWPENEKLLFPFVN